LRSAIGGRWAVSLPGYLLAAPFSLVLIFTTVSEAFWTRDGWLLGLLAGVSSYLVAGAVLWLASVSVLRNRNSHPAPIWLVAAVGAAAWGLRSTYIAWFIAAAGLPNTASPLARTLSGSMVGAILVPGVAWVLANISEFRRERRDLLEQLVEREVQTENAQAYLDVMRTAVVTDVRRAVDQEFSQLPDNPADQAFVPAIDKLSRRMSGDLPRALWQDARVDSRLRVAHVVALAAHRPLALWPIPILALTAAVFMTRLVPVLQAPIAPIATAAWAVVTVLLANRWSPTIASRLGPTPTVVLAGIGMAMSGLVFYLAAGLIALAPTPRLTVSIVLGLEFAFFCVGAAVGRAVSLDRRQAREYLRESISAADVRNAVLAEEEARLRRELATSLHGTVGANLTAASMRLRRAIDTGDTQVALEALHEARRMVALELSDRTTLRQTDVSELIDQIAQAWRGFATVTGTSNCDSSLPPAAYRTINDVVTEGIRNAIRHGQATQIQVDITQDDDEIVITVSDDGTQSATSSPGLGTRIFDTVAEGRWSRTPSPEGGSTLTVVLAHVSAPER